MPITRVGVVSCAHSSTSPDDITALVAREWGIAPTGSAVLVSYGLNDHFHQPTARGPVVVRVYQKDWRTDDDVLWELELLTHLRRGGGPVAAPVPTSTGALAVAVDAPEGRRQVAVFEHATGRDTWGQWTSTPDGEHLRLARAYGAAVGSIHRLADSFVTTHRRFALDLDHLLESQVADVEPRLDAPPGTVALLTAVARALRPELEGYAANAMDWGPCHGDLHCGNARGDAGWLRFFDFDCGGPSWRAYDIAVTRWSIATSAPYYDTTGQWESFLEGYTSEHSLSDAQLDATGAFAIARQLFFFGVISRNTVKAGYGWQGDGFWTPGIDFLRRWLAEGIWF